MIGDESLRSELLAELVALIGKHGSIPFGEFVELALYHPTEGFFSAQGSAGRRGDFMTSPEVGPLFGAVLARAFDEWWTDLGRPDPFVVVEAGAGVGTLARTVLAARPDCADALTYVLAERSERLRARQGDHLELSSADLALGVRGPRVISLAEMPATTFTGVVVANELLDNLPFGLLERRAGAWHEVRVGLGPDEVELVEVVVAAPKEAALLAERLAPGAAEATRVPIQSAACNWLRTALSLIERGRVVVIDYASSSAEMAERPWSEWVRTYRGHGPGGAPFDSPGRQDITCEVAVDQLARCRVPTQDRSQAEFLGAHGIDELVTEGKRIWRERAHVGDLASVVGRSRVIEAEALTDRGGLGAFRVLEWHID